MEQKEYNGNHSSPNPAEEEGDHTLRQPCLNHSWRRSLADLDEEEPFSMACADASPVIRKYPSSASFGLDEEAYLLKVPHQLRQLNESAYEPQLISIGPYHHCKQHLIEMEVYKKRCLQRILERNGDQNHHRYRDAIDFVRARKWYFPSLPNKIEAKFKAIMLVDGCFIVELLRQMETGEYDDPIFQKKWVQNSLLGDLVLFENQLPFFVLVGLYHVIEDPTDGKDFACRAFSVLSNFLPGPQTWKENLPTIKDTDNIKDLLSLLHDNWSPSPQGIRHHQDYYRTKDEKARAGQEAREKGGLENKWKFTLCAVEKPKEKKFQGDAESGVTITCCAREKENLRKGLLEWQSLRCATELKEAGIQFMNSTEESGVNSLFDISFTNATMKIPTFVVEDDTERLFRNLIAYELYEEGSTYVIDYVTLMDNLINSSKDVQLLRFSEIIENMLGDDEAVAIMFNKLRDHVILCGDTFYYEEIFVDVKRHCARRWNTWKAKLRHDYFNSPWALISFIAALLVILLTIGQFVTALIPLVK